MSPLALIIHDAVSPQAAPDVADVLVQVDAVSKALVALDFRVLRIPVSGTALGVLETLKREDCDIVFNLVESLNGEGRFCHLVPLLLEAAQARFTGCGSTAMLVTSNKLLAKTIMSASGVPTAPWFDEKSIEHANEPGPWIVKSVWEHASIGLDPASVVVDTATARSVIADRRRRFGGDWFVERYVDGREFNVSMLEGKIGPEVLAVAEMRFVDFGPDEPHIVDYAAKWNTTSAAYDRTRPSFARSIADAALYDRIDHLALRCWDVFGLEGYARVDFRVDDSGQPFVLEVNANPCLSPGAGLALASAQGGTDYCSLVACIVEASRSRTRASRAAA